MPCTLKINLTDDQIRYLNALRFSVAIGGLESPSVSKAPPLNRVLEHLVASVADGVRRSGSWERGCVDQLFGVFPDPDVVAEVMKS